MRVFSTWQASASLLRKFSLEIYKPLKGINRYKNDTFQSVFTLYFCLCSFVRWYLKKMGCFKKKNDSLFSQIDISVCSAFFFILTISFVCHYNIVSGQLCAKMFQIVRKGGGKLRLNCGLLGVVRSKVAVPQNMTWRAVMTLPFVMLQNKKKHSSAQGKQICYQLNKTAYVSGHEPFSVFLCWQEGSFDYKTALLLQVDEWCCTK